MTQTEAIAEAIRSFEWGHYAATSNLAEGIRLEGDSFVEPLAKHIREQTQGSRWQSIDPNPTTEEPA